MKKNYTASHLLAVITLFSFALTSCGKNVNQKTKTSTPTPNTVTQNNVDTLNEGHYVDPFEQAQSQQQSQQQQQQQQTGKRTSKNSSVGSDDLKTGSGKVRSCSTRVNAGAIETGVLATGLTVGAVFAGPLLFIPAAILAEKSHRFQMSKNLMKAAIKIVYNSSDNNQLVDYAAHFLDRKKKNLNSDEKSVFNRAKKSLEKALSKALNGSVSISDAEFAERVFTYDLRGSLCEGGIKGFSETKEIINTLTLQNKRIMKPSTQNNCNQNCASDCAQSSCGSF